MKHGEREGDSEEGGRRERTVLAGCNGQSGRRRELRRRLGKRRSHSVCPKVN